MYLEHEFEHVIKHDGHRIAVIEGRVIFHVLDLIEFDWKISELWLRDSDSGELFKLDLNCRLGQEIMTWLSGNHDLVVRQQVGLH
jgi:hypothetical protein